MTSSLSELFDKLNLSFSFSIDKKGICHVAMTSSTDVYVERKVSIKDGVSILQTAIPEILQDQSPDMFSSKTNIFPEFVVKTTDEGDSGSLRAILYAPACRRNMKMKWRYSSENNLEKVHEFLSSLRAIVGDEAYVQKWQSLGIKVNLQDLSVWEIPEFMYPPLVGSLRLSQSSVRGVYNFSSISYYSCTVSKEHLLLPNCTHNSMAGNNHFPRVPLPNFFDSNSMCFGSIVKPPGLDVKKSWNTLDFYLRVIYTSAFNTDLYDPNRFKKWDEVYNRGLNIEAVLVKVFGLTSSQLGQLETKLNDTGMRNYLKLMSQIIFCASEHAAY